MTPAAIRLECLKIAAGYGPKFPETATLHDHFEAAKQIEQFVRAAPDFPGDPVGVRVHRNVGDASI